MKSTKVQTLGTAQAYTAIRIAVLWKYMCNDYAAGMYMEREVEKNTLLFGVKKEVVFSGTQTRDLQTKETWAQNLTVFSKSCLYIQLQ